MDKPDFYQVVADMMIKQYRVPGDVNVPLLTEVKVLNVIREITQKVLPSSPPPLLKSYQVYLYKLVLFTSSL